MDMNLSKLWEMVKDREARLAVVHRVTKSQTWLSNRKQQSCLWNSCWKIINYANDVNYILEDVFIMNLVNISGMPDICCCCWVTSFVSDSARPHRRQPTRIPHPWDSPGKNTGMGCHFLLQCMKVKSESEVAQSCPTLSDPMDCSLPGSSIHGSFQARVLEWGAIAFSRHMLVNINCSQILYK